MAEVYREGPESTFTSNGKTYALDVLFRRTHGSHAHAIEMSKLTWVLGYATPDPERMAKVDMTVPVMVLHDPFGPKEQEWLVVDGLHRLALAAKLGLTKINAKFVNLSDMRVAEIKGVKPHG